MSVFGSFADSPVSIDQLSYYYAQSAWTKQPKCTKKMSFRQTAFFRALFSGGKMKYCFAIWIAMLLASFQASAEQSNSPCPRCSKSVTFENSNIACIKTRVAKQLSSDLPFVVVKPGKCESAVSDDTRNEAVRERRTAREQQDSTQIRTVLITRADAACLLTKLATPPTSGDPITVDLRNCR